MEAESHSVLLVSRDSKIISQVSAFLVPPLFELTTTSDFNEARRLATERTFNIIIADSGDGYDTDFAINVPDSYSTILLLVPHEHFDEISYRVMMGEYIIYYRGKIVGGIYDDRFLVKPTKSAVAMMPDADTELPYEGAKEMLLVDNVENRDFLRDLLEAMYDELPAVKKKK